MLSQYNFRQELLIIMFHVLCIVCYAQQDYTSNYNVDVPNMPFLSPEAASLGKYGEIPVSEYTGVPQIEIPLYTVKSGELELPISLSYHASGIKVNQEATWVGLGWDLMAGGCINRIVSGENDVISHDMVGWDNVENVANYLADSWEEPQSEYHTGSTDGNTDRYTQSLLFGLSHRYYEPDIFQANFCGLSFSYYLHPGTRKAVVIGNVNGNYKIEHVSNGNIIRQWKITDNLGVEYYFEEEGVEIAHSESVQAGYNSSWFITRIKHPQKGDISFTYHRENTRTVPTLCEFYTFYDPISNYVANVDFASSDSECDPISEFPLPYQGRGESMNPYDCYINSVYLDKITTTDCEVTFFSAVNSRLDVGGGRKLDSLLIKAKAQNKTIKKVTFHNNSYFEKRIHSVSNESAYYSGYYGDNRKYYRLCLDSLNIGEETYRFSYIEKNNMPSKSSYSVDFWGYYNGMSNNSLICSCDINDSTSPFTQANRYVDPNFIKNGMLSRVEYPTRGYTEFVYEPNEIDFAFIDNYKYPSANEATNYRSTKNYEGKSYGAGLRIKDIKNYDENGNLVQHKSYNYSGGRLMLPLPKIIDDYYITISFNVSRSRGYCQHHYGYYQWTTHTIYSSANVPAFTAVNSVPIGYDRVSVNSNGIITETNYSNEPPVNKREPDIAYFQNLDQGRKKFQRVYDIDGTLMLQKEWRYNKIVDTILVANIYATDFCNGNSAPFSMSNPEVFDRYRITAYPFLIQRYVPTRQYEITRHGDSFVCDTTLYFYNDSTYLLSRMCKSSEIPGQYQIYDIKYPTDNLSCYNGNVLQNMIERNMLAYPVETKLTFNGNIIERNRNVFSNNLIGNDSIPVLTERQWAQGVRDFKTRLKIAYDSHGNFVEVRKNDGKPISFLWGYNWSLPVAVIDGVSYNSISNNTKEVIGTINGTYLGQQLENLASQYASGKFYTYDTLVGITSELSPNGYKVNYGYDSFGRLSLMYDILGSPQNPLKRFEYNYAH